MLKKRDREPVPRGLVVLAVAGIVVEEHAVTDHDDGTVEDSKKFHIIRSFLGAFPKNLVASLEAPENKTLIITHDPFEFLKLSD